MLIKLFLSPVQLPVYLQRGGGGRKVLNQQILLKSVSRLQLDFRYSFCIFYIFSDCKEFSFDGSFHSILDLTVKSRLTFKSSKDKYKLLIGLAAPLSPPAMCCVPHLKLFNL